MKNDDETKVIADRDRMNMVWVFRRNRLLYKRYTIT